MIYIIFKTLCSSPEHVSCASFELFPSIYCCFFGSSFPRLRLNCEQSCPVLEGILEKGRKE